ncbi:MAG: diguanylate cyclase [Campylobacterota bacterium]|nr:diguanylate cyclase [Campylobacterota bacterium]
MLDYTKEITILYVEDEDDVREGYSRALNRISKELYTAPNGSIGLELYKKYNPDIVISDIRMPVMNGLEMVKEIKDINPDVNIIFTTAHSESSYLLEAIELHVEGYLLKPVQKKSMITLIEKLAKHITLEKENIEQKLMLQHIIDAENSLSIITNLNTISFASKSFLNLFGLEKIPQLNSSFESILDIVADSNTLINKEKILKSIDEGGTLYQYIQGLDETKRVATIKDFDGNLKSFYINISKINDTNLLIGLTDITKMEQKLEETQKKAYLDGLTRVYNRNKFQEVFEYQLKQYKRYKQSFSIAILDIDHFKKFNDKYGHLIGDEVLIILAKTMKENMRETDTFARWGGEEFVILLNNTTLENAIKRITSFKDDIENLEHEVAGKITASFGVTQVKDNDTMDSIFKRSDDALYIAKASGRNCVESKI